MFRCRLCRSGTIPPGSRLVPNRDTIRMKLPMHPVNGKRPIVELVMLQNGKYQPIKFSNNVQVRIGQICGGMLASKCDLLRS